MSINNSQRGAFATELSETMTGAAVLIGTLQFNPVILIFDNQGGASVGIYVNGTAAENLWRTFPAGEALVLDLRTQAGVAANYTFDLGTAFYGLGASGDFSISYTYAMEHP